MAALKHSEEPNISLSHHYKGILGQSPKWTIKTQKYWYGRACFDILLFCVMFILKVGFFVHIMFLFSVLSLMVSSCVSLIILIKSLGLVYIFRHVCLALFVEFVETLAFQALRITLMYSVSSG